MSEVTTTENVGQAPTVVDANAPVNGVETDQVHNGDVTPVSDGAIPEGNNVVPSGNEAAVGTVADAVVVSPEEVATVQDASPVTDLRDPAATPTPVSLAGRTSDSDDVNRSWTSQSEDVFVDEAKRPGQAFLVEQLPRPEVQVAAGINPEAYQSGLTVVDRAPEDKALVPDDVVNGRLG